MAPLLARAAAADRAFERLYRRHAHDVYRYAFAVLRNQADAEDVTQTTFMNAYRAFERGEEPEAPHNWLISIAHRLPNCSRRSVPTAGCCSTFAAAIRWRSAFSREAWGAGGCSCGCRARAR